MRSMTGYSKIVYEDESFSLKLEIKSINNKNLNLKLKSPYSINFLENSIRTEVASKVTRGSVDLKIDFRDKREVEDQYTYDKDLSHAYMNILKNMERDFSDKFISKMDVLVKNLNVIQKKDFEINEEEYSAILFSNLSKLLDDFIKSKEAEGIRLRDYFIEKVSIIESKILEINKYKDIVVENYKTALLERLNKIKDNIEIDDADILKEILLYTDKCDISEELSRLESHMIQLKEDIMSDNPVIGKKIDFILQEIFRELNTAGVKSNMYDISKLVVECKNEIERIREQVMNIE
ncbi:YicC family protein [Fusobacterium sp. PH5-44]|uniref:YicC family protein n=1 Tax=unclassified Fusobacterium TaxID=2648384 RepID=UPI003D193744